MPSPRENDPQLEDINLRLKDWRQGDCVLGEHWFSWSFAPDMPITRGAIEAAADTDGEGGTEEQCPGFAIVTQTCDVVRSCEERPFLEVCPLVEIEEISSVRDGKRPRYAYLHGLELLGLVVDLDRVMTVEKPLLVRLERVQGCLSDQDQRNFAEALARKRERFAFPDDFTHLVSRLSEKMKRKHGKMSDQGTAMRDLREIRVFATPSWVAEEVELFFYFIKKGDDASISEEKWSGLLDDWLKLVPPEGRYTKVEGLVSTLEDIKASEYVQSDRLDLDYLSLTSQPEDPTVSTAST